MDFQAFFIETFVILHNFRQKRILYVSLNIRVHTFLGFSNFVYQNICNIAPFQAETNFTHSTVHNIRVQALNGFSSNFFRNICNIAPFQAEMSFICNTTHNIRVHTLLGFSNIVNQNICNIAPFQPKMSLFVALDIELGFLRFMDFQAFLVRWKWIL